MIQVTQILIIHILIVSRFRNKSHNDIKLLCALPSSLHHCPLAYLGKPLLDQSPV